MRRERREKDGADEKKKGEKKEKRSTSHTIPYLRSCSRSSLWYTVVSKREESCFILYPAFSGRAFSLHVSQSDDMSDLTSQNERRERKGTVGASDWRPGKCGRHKRMPFHAVEGGENVKMCWTLSFFSLSSSFVYFFSSFFKTKSAVCALFTRNGFIEYAK